MQQAFATAMDYIDPYFKRVQELNKKGIMPRYHLKDGEPPMVIDLLKSYPKEKLIFIYENGYIYVGRPNGEKLFMSMHSMSNRYQEVKEYVDYLVGIRNKSFE